MMNIDEYRYVVYTTNSDKPLTEIYFCGNGKWSVDKGDAKVYHSLQSVKGAFAVMKRKYLGMIIGEDNRVKSVGWMIKAD